MKTSVIIGMAAGMVMVLFSAMVIGGGTALADSGPHRTEAGATPDRCASCHRIHTGESEYLLMGPETTVTGFCYVCHGTSGVGSNISVQNGTWNGAGVDRALRGGGFDEARIWTTDPGNRLNPPSTIGVLGLPAPTNSSHTLDVETTGWGNGAINSGAGAAFTLECTSCHNPHGNGQYRILRPEPTGSGAPVAFGIPDTYPATYTTPDYFNMYFGGVAPPNPISDDRSAGVSILYDTSRWCAQCHTRYLAESHAALDVDGSRVDSGDDIFAYRHTSTGYSYSSHGSPAGYKYNNRACITCHASHGSNAAMTGAASQAVEWPDAGANLAGDPDGQRASMLKMDNRGMCLKCHGIE